MWFIVAVCLLCQNNNKIIKMKSLTTIEKNGFKDSSVIHVSINKIKKNLAQLECERIFNQVTRSIDRKAYRVNQRLLKYQTI